MHSQRLVVERHASIPLREVSGLCTAHRKDGTALLLAVGDATSELAWGRLEHGELVWETADLANIAADLRTAGSQIEGIAADVNGHVLLLQEGPARVIAVDAPNRRHLVTILIDVPEDTEVGRSWARDENSRGEGIVPLRGGHVLVVKEKRPAALLELGPAGEAPWGIDPDRFLAPGASLELPDGPEATFTPLAVWLLDDELADHLGDVSDAAVGPDRRLYLLSDQSSALCRIATGAPPAGGMVSAEQCWRIEGKPKKAEGLAILPDGRALVAFDAKKTGHNLVLLTPPVV